MIELIFITSGPASQVSNKLSGFERTAGQGLYPDLTLPDLHTFIRLKYIKVKFKLFKLEHIRTFSLPPKQLNVNCLFFPELKRISN